MASGLGIPTERVSLEREEKNPETTDTQSNL